MLLIRYCTYTQTVMPHLNDKKMKEINGIRIIDNKEVVEPVFKHFNLEYGDNSVIVKVLNLLNKISKEDLFE